MREGSDGGYLYSRKVQLLQEVAVEVVLSLGKLQTDHTCAEVCRSITSAGWMRLLLVSVIAVYPYEEMVSMIRDGDDEFCSESESNSVWGRRYRPASLRPACVLWR